MTAPKPPGDPGALQPAAPQPAAPAPPPRVGRMSLMAWFLLLSLLSVSLVSVAAAVLLSRFVTERMLMLDVKVTTEFVNHMFQFERAESELVKGYSHPPPEALARFFAHVGQMPDVLRANVYLPDGTVFWSTDKRLVGRRFADNEELEEAAQGHPSAELGRIGPDDKQEHVNLGAPGTRFIENYIPIYREGDEGEPVLGVAEVYRTPEALLGAIRAGDGMIFVVAAAGALLIIGTLCWLVGYAERVIRRQAVAIADSERLATAGEMAAAVAHGLRNPLAAIRSSAELGLRLQTTERILPLLDDIVLQADRLEHWVRQYLTAVEPHKQDRCDDLRQVLASVRSSLGTELERQGIAWQEQLDEPLPPVAMGAALLEQLLSGIAANAVEAMPEGGSITVAAKPSKGSNVVVQVSDTGCGMTADQIERAFQPFVTSKQSGLGLGLALARRIVTRHRGHIVIASTPGTGTMVSLSLPIAR